MNLPRLEHANTILERFMDGDAHLDVSRGGIYFPRWNVIIPNGSVSAHPGAWFARDPEFQAQGLSVSSRSDWTPRYRCYVGQDALQHFFELSPFENNFLFDHCHSDRVEHAVERLQLVIKGEGLPVLLPALEQQKWEYLSYPLTSPLPRFKERGDHDSGSAERPGFSR